MKRIAFAVFLAIACLSIFVVSEETTEFYSDKYDDIDVDEILNNERLRRQFVGCAMETDPCLTPVAKFLQEHFAEAIVTKCQKCTEKQKVMFGKVVEWHIKNRPQEWEDAVRHSIEVMQSRSEKSNSKDAE